ncbi:copper chaperone PCu(A)C [Streptomyces sp. NPDC101225]|uniref:copper chaperone PCu(A)C n=1 Tax=Streptomyces sp. NPDC101225 TaxID=3366135 RepID=UPI00381C6F40
MKRITYPLSSLKRPDRRRLWDGALAALVPVAACSVALAGSPAAIRVTAGKVLLPSDGVPETAAFFHIANEGGSADTLIRITARDVPGEIALSRHRMQQGNAAYRSTIDSVSVAAGDSLTMSPNGVDLWT